jgi:hypothetical protein
MAPSVDLYQIIYAQHEVAAPLLSCIRPLPSYKLNSPRRQGKALDYRIHYVFFLMHLRTSKQRNKQNIFELNVLNPQALALKLVRPEYSVLSLCSPIHRGSVVSCLVLFWASYEHCVFQFLRREPDASPTQFVWKTTRLPQHNKNHFMHNTTPLSDDGPQLPSCGYGNN